MLMILAENSTKEGLRKEEGLKLGSPGEAKKKVWFAKRSARTVAKGNIWG